MDNDAFADVVVLTVKAALAPVLAECAALKTQLAALTELHKDVAALRERVAVAEVRQLTPGPPGKDGADGVGFDDMAASFDGERGLVLTWTKDGRTKTCPIYLPYPRYQGTWTEGKLYAPGDVVTQAGSAWYCHDTTAAKPGEGSTVWQLMVKRGRDGAQGAPGRDAYPPPVVSTGAK
jgi:hypothetical protein